MRDGRKIGSASKERARAIYLILGIVALAAILGSPTAEAGSGAVAAPRVKEVAKQRQAEIQEAPRPLVKAPTTFTYLRRSDTPFSPRFRRPGWTNSFRSFQANRILWSYADGTLINDLDTRSVPMQCTVPFWVPAKDPNADSMACLSANGGYGGLQMDVNLGARRPDINSEAWRAYQLGQVKRLIDTGCTTFQQDDPVQNATSLPKGCYAADSVSKFRTYLSKKYSPDQLSKMGVTNLAAFDVRRTNSTQISDAYAEFQRVSVEQYHVWLHAAAAAYLKTRNPSAKLIFSGNLTNEQLPDEARYMKHFSFMVSEMYLDRDNAAQEFRRVAKAFGARSSVNAVTVASNDVWLNQRSIASAYAFGMAPIAPWDIYISSTAPRYNGKPSDYVNLFEIVRKNSALFDDYASYTDETGRLVSVLPIEGVVSKASTLAQVADAIDKTKAATFNVGNPPKRIARGRLGALAPSTKVPSVKVYARALYLTTVRLNAKDPKKKVVHVVSWNDAATPTLSVLLKRSDFPIPPTRLFTDKSSEVKQVAPIVIGDYYGYAVGPAMWAILAP